MRWSEQQFADHLAKTGAPGARSSSDTSAPPFLPAFGAIADPYEGMNKLERAYAEHLEAERGRSIVWWAYESIKLRLADRTTYTPDFFVQMISGAIEVRETKGFMRDDAAVKLKVAAELYPFRFFLVRKGKNGSWSETAI
jgi:hypothetical protein